MMNKSIFNSFSSAFRVQTKTFNNEEIDISNFPKLLNISYEKYLYCLNRKKTKYIPYCILKHADEYTTFLTILARQAYLLGYESLAESTYLLNRRLNGFDCFYTRDLPSIFHLEHPIGSIIGQSKLGNYLVVYQGVTIGGDLNLNYPKLGEGIALYANASLIGKCTIASNCAIGSGVQLFSKDLKENHCVSMRNELGQIISSLKWSIKERYFKS